MGIIGDGHVRVTTSVLRQKAGECTAQITQMKEYLEDLDEIMKRTSGYWIGEAGDVHRKLYTDQIDSINEMMERLQEHPADLLHMAGVYDNTEAENASAARSLSGNVIE